MARKPDLPCAQCGELMWRGKGVLPEGQATCLACRRKAAKPQRQSKSVTVWDCAACGKRCERKPTKGQRPKWCAECREKSAWSRRTFTCEHCGQEVQGFGTRYCSMVCTNRAKPPKPRKPKPPPTAPFDPRGELRRGYEDGDPDLFFAALVATADTSGDCWIWRRLNKSGYPVVSWSKREVALHRAVVEMKHGAPLGSQHAHHICATAACVNPDHLQPVTHRENVAEMLARQSYLARIRELEAALADVDPDHPLLAVLAVA